ncbi:DEAD/DEAH box helicase [Candidatus Woesearchaeota archaeon]|nr:DEAD/DEAH box helicase [Candidatus Woesearchaeota archaeon]
MKAFEQLGIESSILKALENKGFDSPTHIQEKAIPHILKGEDVVGQSETGSGKTLAFGAGIIQNIRRGQGIGALILTPTRELAEQVSSALQSFSTLKPLKITAVYGGVGINPQINSLQKADVVVATPGRLLDHLERRTINLSKVQILVLDEADRMVDMGFIDDVKKIITQCPRKRQTLLFSATLSQDIKNIEQRFMHNPIRISARQHVDPTKLTQSYYDTNQKMKFSLLIHLLKNDLYSSILIFCNTRRQVDFLTKNLTQQQISAVPIHGGFTQAKRSDSMKKFQTNKSNILVCTDVAARGLDIPNVSHVYNYDLPQDSKEYIHRIGRTARAGKKGSVVNLVADRDHDNFSSIITSHRELKITRLALPQFEKVTIKDFKKTKKTFKGKSSFTSQKPSFKKRSFHKPRKHFNR